jgi:predicted RNA-binding protein with TRAM domain
VGWETIGALNSGTSYDVSVQAVNAGGDGPQSAAITLSTLANPAASVTVPGIIPWIGEGASPTGQSVSINFSPTYGGGAPSSYSILYRITGSSSWMTYGSVSSVGWQTLSRLQPGTSYDVSIEAVNAGGSGPQSAVFTQSTLSTGSASSMPPGMIPWIGQGQASTGNTISINFAPPNDGGTPTGYVIMIRVTGQAAWQTYGTVTWTGWQTIGGLSAGTSYDTQVYATNAAGSGLVSGAYTDSTL